MRTSVLPDLIDALVSAATDALPEIRVSDGVGVTDDPSDYLMIGVDDPFADSPEAASSAQDWVHVGTGAQRSETGEIQCAALSWSGDTDPKVVRDRAFATCGAVANLLRPPADSSLGVDGLLWCSFGTTQRYEPSQGDDGCYALVMFSIYFSAQI